MYIARVRVENVRGFHDARSVDLGLERPDGTYAGWTVIAGRNGSGKTSLLRAIALAISGHSSAGVLMPDSSNWITVGRDAGSVGLDLVADPVLDLSGEGDVSEEPLSLSMSWRLARPLRATGRDPQPLLSSGNSPSAWGPWQPNAAGWFCAAYGPFRRLTGGSIDAQRLTQGPAVISRLASLFHEDASLAEASPGSSISTFVRLNGGPAQRSSRRRPSLCWRTGCSPMGMWYAASTRTVCGSTTTTVVFLFER